MRWREGHEIVLLPWEVLWEGVSNQRVRVYILKDRNKRGVGSGKGEGVKRETEGVKAWEVHAFGLDFATKMFSEMRYPLHGGEDDHDHDYDCCGTFVI